MTDDAHFARARIVREARQRLESLRRAGLDRIPSPIVPASRPAPLIPTRIADLIVAEEPAVPAAPPGPPPAAAPALSPPVPPSAPSVSLFGESEFADPIIPAAERPGLLAALAAEVSACTRCPQLAAYRTQTVFGVGTPTARLMFVGEAPGADEDRQGVPFVGRAGQLLTDMITKGMGLKREEVYIANVLKSRPPDNRNPLPDEVGHCLPYLKRQIEIIHPEFLCLLGKVAASALLETTLSISRLRGRWLSYRGIPTMVTYHPSFLLRSPQYKKEAWDDLQMLMQRMGIEPPSRKAR